MFNKDIYLKVFGDNSWELYNKDSLEICSKSYAEYFNIFRILFDTNNYTNLLMIGGGDFQLASYIGLYAPLGATITIVDPVIHDYSCFTKYYLEDIDQIQLQDSINHENVIYKYKEQVFSKAYPSIKNNTYETIVIDCSEEINPNTNEIYKSKKFIRQLYSLLITGGSLYIYIPPAAIFMKEYLENYFKLVDSQSKFIEAWGETATFYQFIKTEQSF